MADSRQNIGTSFATQKRIMLPFAAGSEVTKETGTWVTFDLAPHINNHQASSLS